MSGRAATEATAAKAVDLIDWPGAKLAFEPGTNTHIHLQAVLPYTAIAAAASSVGAVGVVGVVVAAVSVGLDGPDQLVVAGRRPV